MKFLKNASRFIITALVGLIFTGLVISISYAVANKNGADFKFWLSVMNGTSIAGILLICFGVLVWSASEGSFDGVVYASKQVFHTLRYKTKYPVSYADYVEAKHGKEKAKISHFFIVGLVFTIISFIVYGCI